MAKIREYPIIHDTVAGIVSQDQVERWKLGHDRYEKLKKLSSFHFARLVMECQRTGVFFDELVDRLPGKDK